MMDQNQDGSHKFPGYMTDNSDFQFHFSEHTTVVTCKKPTHILAGNYSHLNYEFFIAITDINGLTVEGQPLSIPAGMVCPILSCQPHGALHLVSDVRFISIQFERRFFDRIVQSVSNGQNFTYSNTLFDSDPTLEKLTSNFISEQRSQEAGTGTMLEGVSIQMGVWLLRRLAASNPEKQASVQAFRKIDSIIQTIQKEHETDFSLSKLSKSAHVNKYTLIEQFRNHTGMTPYEYYQHNRIMKSLEMLKYSSQSILEIALHCGFKTHSHFSKVFRCKTGLTPSEYRRRYH